jgi:predicted transcriptional regulator
MGMRVLTAHVSVEFAERVDELAKRRPRGWIVKQALATRKIAASSAA